MASANGDLAGSLYSIRAVQRVCDILTYLQESPLDVSLMDIAKVANLAKSSAFRYVNTLEEQGLIERDPITGSYRAGAAFQGPRAQGPELLTRRAQPHLELLRDQSQETISLGMLDGDRVTYLAIMESPRALRLAARPGDRDPIHSTALGKAIAAGLPDEQVHAILACAGLAPMTAQTITDADAYLADLTAVRTRGYALENGEHEVGGRCVAVPLPGTVPAAIGLGAPAARLPLRQVTEIAAALKEVVVALDGAVRHPAA